MSIVRRTLFVLLCLCVILCGGCATLHHSEPIDVIMTGLEPLQGDGLEVRMLVKLRIQNPNDAPFDFNGVSVKMDVQGKPFASGVSDAAGSVPRFGETTVSVPVSIPLFRIARQTVGVISSEYSGKLEYEMTGKLAGPAFDSVRFSSKGVLTLPSGLSEGGK